MTSRSTHLRSDARAILKLGAPLIVNNLANTGMTFADTVMAGRLGARELAGLAVGVGYYNLCFFLGLGLLLAISPHVAHAYGAGDHGRIGIYLRQAWWIALAIGVVAIFIMQSAGYVLPVIGIDPQIVPVAAGYCKAVSWGFPGFFAFLALRYTGEGLGRTTPIMFIGLFGLALNVFGNWVLAFGNLGAPALGTVGLAIATAITMWAMFVALLMYMRMHPAYRPYRLFTGMDAPSGPVLGELLRIGVPITGSLLCEGGLFIAAAMLMGTLGPVTASAHQIALNYASIMFMIPLALCSATTIHVGHTLGAGHTREARRGGFVGIALCGLIMAVSAIAIVLWNEHIAALYTNDRAVLDVAGTLLLIAAVFQISDGLQVGAAGALRGFKDTAVPLVICFVSYWVIGMPISYLVGIARDGGPVYVWAGLVIGLSVAVLLNARYHLLSKRVAQGTRAVSASSALHTTH